MTPITGAPTSLSLVVEPAEHLSLRETRLRDRHDSSGLFAPHISDAAPRMLTFRVSRFIVESLISPPDVERHGEYYPSFNPNERAIAASARQLVANHRGKTVHRITPEIKEVPRSHITVIVAP